MGFAVGITMSIAARTIARNKAGPTTTSTSPLPSWPMIQGGLRLVHQQASEPVETRMHAPGNNLGRPRRLR